MRLNAFFPTRDIGTDPAKIRDWAQAAEDLGYAHIEVPDHVFGATARDGWVPIYNEKDAFHETFVTIGFLAAVTKNIGLTSGVLISPQRQTGLIAKQAAEADVLSGGRIRLGIGVGWNAVEYEALGEDFGNRGKRSAEQIELLRRLWTEQSVTFAGDFHTVTGAGIAPLPVQRPIPVWVGAASPPGYKRAGRLADGWFPMMTPGPALVEARTIVETAARDAGRDPATIGMEGRVDWRGDGDAVADQLTQWEKSGATHVSVNTMGAGLKTVDDHLTALARVAGLVPLS